MKELAVQTIDDIPKSVVQSTLELLEWYLDQGKAKEVEVLQKGYGVLYRVGDRTSGYYFLVQQHKVVYFVRYGLHSAIKDTHGLYQVLVWRDALAPTHGVVQKIITSYLLPEYGVLFSDSKQTRDGAHFWYVMLQHFVEDGSMHVYTWDESNLVELTSLSQLQAAQATVWGPTQSHAKLRILLARSPIKA